MQAYKSCTFLDCSFRLYVATHCQTVAVMVSYDLVLWGRSLRRVFGEPSSSPCELGGAEQLPVSASASSSTGVLNEPTFDLLLLVALEQFKDQAFNRPLFSAE